MTCDTHTNRQKTQEYTIKANKNVSLHCVKVTHYNRRTNAVSHLDYQVQEMGGSGYCPIYVLPFDIKHTVFESIFIEKKHGKCLILALFRINNKICVYINLNRTTFKLIYYS